MNRNFRLTALLLAASSTLWWWSAGSHIGWWQTQVAIARTDEVTGLVVQEWQKRFVPGLETPALGLLLSAGLLGGSIFFHRKTNLNTT